MFTEGGIDGFCARRYSLPIHSHLVACANPKFVVNDRNRVRFSALTANSRQEFSAITFPETSNEQLLSALEAGTWEEL